MSLDPQQLEIDSSDVTLGTLSKAFKWVWVKNQNGHFVILFFNLFDVC